MKTSLYILQLLLIFVFFTPLIQGRQSSSEAYNEWFHQANTAGFNFQDSLALSLFHKAFEYDSEEVNGLWSVAIIHGRLGSADSSMFYLEKAVKAGWKKTDWIERSSELQAAQKAFPERWNAILQPLKLAERESIAAKGYHVKAYYALDSLGKLDQQVRNQLQSIMGSKDQSLLDSLAKLVEIQDEFNLKALKAIMEELGDIPTFQTVGAKGEGHAFIIVQHADQDAAFQESYLEKMKAHGKDKVSLSHIAYLTDRTMTNREGTQLFGTQVNGETGKLYPIKELENLINRRMEYGLGNLDDFKKYCEILGCPMPEGLDK